jgi:hypothetical protein
MLHRGRKVLFLTATAIPNIDARMLRSTLVIIQIFFCSFTAFGSAVEGLIQADDSATYLVVWPEKTKYLLSPVTSGIREEVRRLQTGDYVSGSGRIDNDKRIIALDLINVVGLKKLLGIWRTADWNVFEFRDFSRLYLYARFQGSSSLSHFEKRNLSYTLAPEASGSWSIFLSDNRTVHVGTLSINDRDVHLEVFDVDTGDVRENIQLFPMSSGLGEF